MCMLSADRTDDGNVVCCRFARLTPTNNCDFSPLVTISRNSQSDDGSQLYYDQGLIKLQLHLESNRALCFWMVSILLRFGAPNNDRNLNIP